MTTENRRPAMNEHTTIDGEVWWRDDRGVWRDESGLAVLPDELTAEGLEIDEDPTAGFTYCIEKGTGWE
jgi:hypothetical protein